MNIVFAHNVYKRHKQMIKTINNNRQFIDDGKTVVVSNGHYLSFINYLKIDNIQFRQLFRNKEHKIGALEGMITAMKLASKLESDIIIISIKMYILIILRNLKNTSIYWKKNQ